MVSEPVSRILAERGHIVGAVNPVPQKRGYWVNENDPPPIGNAEFPPIMDAPGANVLEK